MNNQLVVRWTPDSIPATGISYEQRLTSGMWVPITKAQIDKSMRAGTIIHWNPITD